MMIISCVVTLNKIRRLFCVRFRLSKILFGTISSYNYIWCTHLKYTLLSICNMAKEKAMHLISKCLGESGEGSYRREQKRINRDIERQLTRDRHVSAHSIKLLLLGTGESGKSTFVKQMKIIHGEGYSVDEKLKYATTITRNIVMAMQMLTEKMDELQISFSDPSNEESATFLNSIDLTQIIRSTDECYQDTQCYKALSAVKILWNDSGVQDCYQNQDDYHISDSITYFLSQLNRINHEDYLPTEQDILRCRVPTSGVLEYSFNIQKHNFRIFDVGGQKTQRRKWIHCFEGVTSVIFLAAMSDYNESCHVLHEAESDSEKGDNRLDVSISLFKLIKHNPWFQHSSMILFLNKKDLFEEKIKNGIDFENHFPEYKGEKCNPKEARNFIQEKFCEKINENDVAKVYSHFTCATDTNNMSRVFGSVRSTILDQNIKDYFY